MTAPKMVTTCIGAAENEVTLEIAYFTSDQVDHLEAPTVRSCTSNSTCVVLNPTQEDSARKNAFFSCIFSSTVIALRSSSLKSDARRISMRVALLMRL